MPPRAIAAAEEACAARRCERAIEFLESAIREGACGYGPYYSLGVCYGGLCRPHPLTEPDMAVSYLRHALGMVGGADGPARAAILEQLGFTLPHSRRLPPAEALRAAAEFHAGAARIWDAAGSAPDRARVHFNLGNSLCDLAETTGEDRWAEAASHYEEALRLRTAEGDAARCAAVLENLGSAYRRLDAGHVRQSIRCYHRALRLYARANRPEKIPALENNLGNAYLSLPDPAGEPAARHARRALRHFDRALAALPDPAARAYAITQYNRAQAFFRLARVLPAGNLARAVDCLEQAGAAFERSGDHRYRELVRTRLEEICRARPAVA